MSASLKPCPFCGHPKARLFGRVETKVRDGEKLLAYEFHPACIEGMSDYEEAIEIYDFRWRFYVRCNKCGARSKIARTEWHVRTEEEAESWSRYQKYFRYEKDGDFAKSAREKAIGNWNTRAERTCRLVKDDCYWRCTECRDMFLTELDIKPKYRYCPSCGAKVVG